MDDRAVIDLRLSTGSHIKRNRVTDYELIDFCIVVHNVQLGIRVVRYKDQATDRLPLGKEIDARHSQRVQTYLSGHLNEGSNRCPSIKTASVLKTLGSEIVYFQTIDFRDYKTFSIVACEVTS